MVYAFHKDARQQFKQQRQVTADHIIPFIEQVMTLGRGMQVLEVGCAEGGALKAFLELGIRGVGEGGPYSTITNTPQSFNLLDLRNGELAGLGEVEIPTGTYDLVRLYISDASIVLKDGSTPAIEFPSGVAKVFISPGLPIVAGLSTEFLLDFDISRSFKAQGGTPPTGFKFSPVVRGENKATTGGVIGTVSDASQVALPNVEVWIEHQDTVVTTAYTDATGFYGIIGLDPDEYTVKAYAAGYDTASTAVTIKAAENQTVDLELLTQP